LEIEPCTQVLEGRAGGVELGERLPAVAEPLQRLPSSTRARAVS
jgi:hypothetical protein